jgi:F420-dependent methylenetetrahydromethanopterin dehydrogenase
MKLYDKVKKMTEAARQDCIETSNFEHPYVHLAARHAHTIHSAVMNIEVMIATKGCLGIEDIEKCFDRVPGLNDVRG